MGVVFAARHPVLEQTVAIKLLRRDEAEDDAQRRRFINEAKASATIENEHVVRVLDVGYDPDGQPYIVMEHLEGIDLGRLLRQRGRLPATEAVEYVLQALTGVAAAHLHGIIHRDLKPANLFRADRRDRSRIVKVLDFGISKMSDGGETTTDAMLGSPAYISPEQARSTKSVDGRTDIWSLGVVLYELLQGKRPFTGANAGQLLVSVLEAAPPPLDGVTSELAAVVMRCLEKEPSARYATAAELARALAPFAPPSSRSLIERIEAMEGTDTAETLTTGPREPDDALARTMKETPALSTRSMVLGGIVGTLVTGGVAALAFVSSSTSPRPAAPPAPVVAASSSPVLVATALPPPSVEPSPPPSASASAVPRPRPAIQPAAVRSAAAEADAGASPAKDADPITRTRKE
jgi:serine/threonine-protein kinase